MWEKFVAQQTWKSQGRNAARLCACGDTQSPGQKRH